MTVALPSLSSFHDGNLISIAVDQRTVRLGLAHVDGREFSWTLAGVEALHVSDFRESNIIYNIREAAGPAIEEAGFSPADIRAFLSCLFPGAHPDAAQNHRDAHDAFLDRQIGRLRDGTMRLVTLAPSYGADLLAYCASSTLIALPASREGSIS